jgi:hypothetical protein
MNPKMMAGWLGVSTSLKRNFLTECLALSDLHGLRAQNCDLFPIAVYLGNIVERNFWQ